MDLDKIQFSNPNYRWAADYVNNTRIVWMRSYVASRDCSN